MRLKLIWIGETRNRHLAALEEDYRNRINRFLSCEIIAVNEEKKSDRHSRAAGMLRESKALERKLRMASYRVALDESGDQVSSRELAGLLENWMVNGVEEVAFVAGGARGIPAEIGCRINKKWSLSRLTLPHELARVVVLEQIYRALTLVKGMPYHK